MPTLTNTVCQSCRNPLTTDYARLGTTVECPHCLHWTVPQVPVGGALPLSGYQLTYRDFCQLLADPQYPAAVGPLIVEWFGFKVDPDSPKLGPEVLVCGKDGVPVDKLWLHLTIQSDSERRETLYQVAMTLWR